MGIRLLADNRGFPSLEPEVESLDDIGNPFRDLPSLEPESLEDVGTPFRNLPSLEPANFGSLVNVGNPFRQCPSFARNAPSIGMDEREITIIPQKRDIDRLTLEIFARSMGWVRRT